MRSFLMSLLALATSGALAATYPLSVTRLSTGELYEVSGGGQLIAMSGTCSLIAANAASTLQVDFNSGTVLGTLTIGPNSCNVGGIYGSRPFIAAGTYPATLRNLGGTANYYLDDIRRVVYRVTSGCPFLSPFDPPRSVTYAVASNGPTYRGGVPFGTLTFPPPLASGSCSLVGIYEWDYMAGGTALLAVAKGGDGGGAIVSTAPAGMPEINCGATCSASFPTGTSVTLAATADAGSRFAGWSGGGCGGGTTCTPALLADASVTALFTLVAGPRPLINISTRSKVLTGEDVLIAGFVVSGTDPQPVIVRARGPSLAANGVAGPLGNPILQLFSGQTQIAVNDDWQAATNAGAIQASGYAPLHPQEAAILMSLAPGAYTAIVTGAAATTGVAIVEVFVP